MKTNKRIKEVIEIGSILSSIDTLNNNDLIKLVNIEGKKHFHITYSQLKNIISTNSTGGTYTAASNGGLDLSNNAFSISSVGVTFNKIQNIAPNSILGNYTNVSNSLSEIGLGDNISFAGTKLKAEGVRIGTLFSDSFNRASLGVNYTIAGTATYACDNSQLVASGGNGSYSNYVYYSPNGVQYASFQIENELPIEFTPNIDGAGAFVVFRGANTSVVGKIDLTSGATRGKIYLDTIAGTTPTNRANSGTNLLTYTNGQKLRISLQRTKFMMRVIVVNTVTGSSVATSWLDLYPIVQPSTPSFTIGFGTLGGTQYFNTLSYISNAKKRPKFLFVGDSFFEGGGASTQKTKFIEQIRQAGEDSLEVMAISASTSAHMVSSLPEFITCNPQYLICDFGLRNGLGVIANNTIMTQIQTFIDSCVANGIIPIIVNCPPLGNSSAGANTTTDTLNTLLNTTFNNKIQIIDINTTLKNGNSFGVIAWFNGDTVHFNDLGTTFAVVPTILAAIDGLSNLNNWSKFLVDALGNINIGGFTTPQRHIQQTGYYATFFGPNCCLMPQLITNQKGANIGANIGRDTSTYSVLDTTKAGYRFIIAYEADNGGIYRSPSGGGTYAESPVLVWQNFTTDQFNSVGINTSPYGPALAINAGTTQAGFRITMPTAPNGGHPFEIFTGCTTNTMSQNPVGLPSGGTMVFRVNTTNDIVVGTDCRFLMNDGVGLLNLGEGVKMDFGTVTGSVIGQAVNRKFAFHGSTPVIQRSGASQVVVVTTASTQTTPFGFSTQAQADSIVTLVNEIRATLVEKGLMKGAA